MDKKQIEEMIDLAIKQGWVILMRHIHIFMWERHFWQRMARIIQDVILKMLLIHQQTVLRGLLLKQSVKCKGISGNLCCRRQGWSSDRVCGTVWCVQTGHDGVL